MKLSARNVFKGTVTEVVKGQVAAKVKVDIGGGNVLASMIFTESVEDLDLKVGDEVSAIIKSTEVIIAR